MRPLAFAALPAALVAGLAGACAHEPVNPPAVVEDVDLERYAGVWFDVGHFPAPFQDDCVCTTATYTPLPGGELEVKNACRVDTPAGERKEATARAFVPDPTEPGKLKVQFFWPFRADYWIVELDPEYRYAVVSNPEREYLWILSRTPELPEGVREELLADLSARGFDLTRLTPSPQVEGCWSNEAPAAPTTSRW